MNHERTYTLHAYSKSEEKVRKEITGWEKAVKLAQELEETCDYIVLNLYGSDTRCYVYERVGDAAQRYSRPPVKPT